MSGNLCATPGCFNFAYSPPLCESCKRKAEIAARGEYEPLPWTALVCSRPENASVIVEWGPEAACRDKDTSLFFQPGMGRRQENDHRKGPVSWREKKAILEVQRICMDCPVRPQCLWYAIEGKFEDGLWGGATLSQRKKIAKVVGRKSA